ncbi:MAG: hypothetical protein HKO59_06270, partial [Phycisphaerales bacterium]|nr:hypothetical protein [Phycisphaerales bacterium]
LERAGVPGLGVHLLAGIGEAATRPEVEQCRIELEASPSGEVDWSSLAARCAANVEALVETHPPLAAHAERLGVVPTDARLYVTRNGNPHVIRGASGGGLRLFFPLADHAGHARRIELPPPRGNLGMLCLGLPVPPLLAHLMASVDPSGYTPPIDIIEPDLAALGPWLHLVDIAGAVRAGRVHLFAGAEAVGTYTAFLERSVTRHPPTVLIRNQRPDVRLPTLDRAQLDATGRRQEQRRADLFTQQTRHYAECDSAFWARRYDGAAGEGPPLSIVAFTTRFSTYIQHAMRDLAAALRRRGCRVEIVMEPDDATAAVDTWTTLAAERHDLILVINHLRFELEGRVDPRIPYVGWIQDHMPALCTPAAGRSVTSYDLVLARNATEMCTRHAYPRERFLPTPNLTDAVLYHPDRVSDDVARAGCDLSYVGHGSGPPEALWEETTVALPAPHRAVLRTFIDAARVRLERRGDMPYLLQLELLAEAEAAHGHPPITPADRERVLLPAAAALGDRIIRHQSLAWAAEWAETRGRRLRLYGRGWDRHPAFARYAAGEVANGPPLRSVYQASTINLQLNGFTAFHQRLLDAIASGGFVLSRKIGRDFMGPACRVIADAFTAAASLDGILARRAADQNLDEAFTTVEALGLARCAEATDPTRQREAGLMTAVWGRPHTDAELFERLRTITEGTDALAGDIPGFADTVFETKQQMFEQLDRYDGDPAARAALVARMRAWVCEHATYDALAGRVLTRLRERFAADAG